VAAEIDERKAALRAKIIAARAQLGEAEIASAAAAIATVGQTLCAGRATVAAYFSVGSEPPTRELLSRLLHDGTRVLLPVVDGTTLDWAEFTDVDRLVPGPLGVAEPAGPRLGVAALALAELVLVPALAVDGAGNRLGRGRGFYDRSLAAVTAPVVAIVYDGELVDAVPVDGHDRAVDGVLRPAGITSCRS
jgi:5-formyltetrahydrofolate cyclo-ligase